MRRLLFSSVLLLVFAGCGEENGGADAGGGRDGSTTGMDSGTGGSDGGGTGTDSGTTGGTDGGIGTWDGNVTGGIVPCQGHIYQCGNGMDDDSDGVADDMDPDCLGPCDNNEGGYYLGIPGGDSAPCQLDCYFDQDQGPGNDGCEWDARCDPLEPDPNPLCAYQDPPRPPTVCPDTQDPDCDTNCGPLVPNGCDCFGCCLFPTAAEPNRYLLIGSREPGTTNAFGCTYEEATKPEGSELCAPCTPVPSCLKGCGECDICLGKDTIPDHCTNTDRCDEGVQPCGLPGDEACGEGFYCLTGCCVFFGVPG